jgi:acetylornithine/succinyldiaminopimelate/putrescine aminotransferase
LVPDAVSWAKGIAGGFPLGAVWISDRPIKLRDGDTIPLCDLLGPGSHGTTFGGTPLICEGALEVLSVIEDANLLENAKKLGKYALEQIQSLNSPWIQSVRGVGLMIGIELVENFSKLHPACEPKSPSIFIVEKLHEAGLMTVPSGTHTIRWLPALNVDKAAIDEATAILSGVLASLQKP